jgi:DNA-binding transcriptional regulator YdaS (Cro superfamily)
MNGSTIKELLRDRGLKAADLARHLSVNKATVSRWGKNRIPAERVLDVERVTGISRSELRPDIYPAIQHQGVA